MEIRNLTPHAVVLVDGGGNAVATLASEGVARASQSDRKVGELEIGGFPVPVVETAFGATEGLPEPTEGVVFIVSFITVAAARAQGRTTSDLLTTSGLVRDAEGRIIGCSQLARN